ASAGCRTCTGVKASSYQKLCRSSVARRRAAASSVSAASGHHGGSARAGAGCGGSPARATSAASAIDARERCVRRARRRGVPAEVFTDGGAEAGVAVDALVGRVRRQVEAAVRGARAVDDRPGDDQADLRQRAGRAGRGVAAEDVARGVVFEVLLDGDVVVVAAGQRAPGAQIGGDARRGVSVEHDVVDYGDGEQQEGEDEQRALDAAQVAAPAQLVLAGAQALGQALPDAFLGQARGGVAHLDTGENSGAVWWAMNSACTPSVAISRRRSRVTTASGSDQSVYHASSQVLVTAIASSVQPE